MAVVSILDENWVENGEVLKKYYYVKHMCTFLVRIFTWLNILFIFSVDFRLICFYIVLVRTATKVITTEVRGKGLMFLVQKYYFVLKNFSEFVII